MPLFDRSIILVAGGAGFVGSNLALMLKRDWPEARIVALDNLRLRGSELALPRLRDGGVEFRHGDVRNPEDLDEVGSFGLLLDCPAEPSVHAGYGGGPAYVVNTNLSGAVNCLEAAREFRCATCCTSPTSITCCGFRSTALSAFQAGFSMSAAAATSACPWLN